MKEAINTCFCQPQEIWRGSLLLYKKGNKKKQHSVCLAVSYHRGHAHVPQRERPGPSILPRKLPSTSQHQATRALTFVCGHLCFILISAMWPLAGHALGASEKPKRGEFGGPKMHNILPYKLMGSAS